MAQDLPLTEFEDMVHSNFDRLSIWHNPGADVEHGLIAMDGASVWYIQNYAY